MKTKYILALTLCLFINAAFSQSAKEKKADKLYESYAYVQASTLYKSLTDKNTANEKVYARLADCYDKVGDFKNAETWYKKVIDSGKATPDEMYAYAQVLKANGKYADADGVMSKFHTAKGTDARGTEFDSKKGLLEKIKADKPYFSLATIEGNTNEADFGATYFNDKVVFASSRKKGLAVSNIHSWNNHPFLDLYTAKKDANNNLSDIKLLNKKIDSKFHEGPACYTTDGKTMYFTRNNFFKHKVKKSKAGINNLELFRAKLVDNKWKEEKLPFDNQEYSVGHPSITADGKTLYFVSDMPGGFGGTDIYKTEVKDDGTFGAPVNLGNAINTEGNEMFPFIHSNGTLFFSSNGHVGFGELDIFASQPNKDGSFSKIINLGLPVNSGVDDFAFVLDKDQKMGYISSNRDGGKGGDDIYSITMLRPLKQTYKIKGTAFDKESKLTLANTKITLTTPTGLVEVTTTDNGKYEFEVEPDASYNLAGSKKDYFDDKATISTAGIDDNPEITKDLYLEKDPGLALLALITDAKTGNPMDGVKMTIVNNVNPNTVNYVTPTTGDYLKPLATNKVGDKLNYTIILEKESYITKTVNFVYEITKPGIIKVQDVLNLKMSKPEVGMDIAKLIDIKPIYFDLGKYNIRPDAAKELDKIVKVLTDYPTMVIELGSHTDCRGSKVLNEKLSDNRAKASAAYVKGKISNPDRIYGKGYGESKLVNGCACEGAVKSTCTETEHQANRRTEFIIIKMD